MSQPQTEPEPHHHQTIGLRKTLLFTVCSIVVLDSFISPAKLGVPAITVRLIAVVLFFIPYGLISAELGSTFPASGGIANWVERAFGEFPCVLVGWMYWLNEVFWMPAVFIAFSDWIKVAMFPSMPDWVMASIAVGMCWLIVWVGIRGIELSVSISAIIGFIKAALLLLMGILGVVYGMKYGFANDFRGSWIPKWDDTIKYTAAIIYNLMGFELINSVGDRIENPQRTIPKMTLIAGLGITVLYVAGTFGILAAIPANSVDTVEGFVYALKELCRVFGSLSDPIFYLLIILAILTLVVDIITWNLGSNETFMSSELGKRSPWLAHRHEKNDTADHLYFLMGIISTGLILLNYMFTGDANTIFWTMFSFSSLVFMLNYMFMFPAALKLRLSDPTPRVYQVPGGLPGMILCVSLCTAGTLLAVIFFVDWDVHSYAFWMEMIGTAITVGSGWVLYRRGKRREQQAIQAAQALSREY